MVAIVLLLVVILLADSLVVTRQNEFTVIIQYETVFVSTVNVSLSVSFST